MLKQPFTSKTHSFKSTQHTYTNPQILGAYSKTLNSPYKTNYLETKQFQLNMKTTITTNKNKYNFKKKQLR